MFTGIIESTGTILKKTESGLVISRPALFDDLKIGCSIAVSGACLSVIAFDDTSMSFDVVPTTLQKTKLGSLNVGDSVNLERAMKADGRFEGHIVTGHVEGTGAVVGVSAHSPSPSPVPVEGSAAESIAHVWKGVSGLIYPPLSVIANAKAMRKEPTKAEEKLWQELRRKKIRGHYFRRQRPVGSCIVDFYCEDLRLAIEVDGGIHDEKNQRAYDLWRAEHLELRGAHILRFSNDEVLNNMASVLVSIEQYIDAPLHPEGGGAGGGGMSEDAHQDLGEGLGVGGGGMYHESLEPKSGVGGGGMVRSDRLTLGEGLGLPDVALAKVGVVAKQGALLTVCIPKPLLPFIIPHGSITLDGVALTVADIQDTDVTVALIPHTLANTTLGSLQIGDMLNLETDILGKYMLKTHGHR